MTPDPDPEQRDLDWQADDYNEMCDEAGVDPLSERGHLLWTWRNYDEDS